LSSASLASQKVKNRHSQNYEARDSKQGSRSSAERFLPTALYPARAFSTVQSSRERAFTYYLSRHIVHLRKRLLVAFP